MSVEVDFFQELTPHQWLPDETLFSLCSRHHLLSGNYKSRTTCLQLFGHSHQGLAHDFPSRIAHFCKVTKDQLGTSNEIVLSRTLLPFYLPFADRELGRTATRSMTGDSIGGLKFRLGLLTSGFRANHPLKACRTCMSVDREQAFIAYWHLPHQLPGVLICPIHHELLQYSNQKATGVGRFMWTLPSDQDMACPTMERPLSSSAKSIALSLAQLAIHITRNHNQERFDQSRLAKTYRSRLTTLGFTRGKSQSLRADIVSKSYVDFLSPLICHPELQTLLSDQSHAATDVRRLTSGLAAIHRPIHHPLRHIALIAWLFESYSNFKATYDSVVHESNTAHSTRTTRAHPLKAQFLDLIGQGTAISTASRSLGVDPSTGMAWASTSGKDVQLLKRPSKIKSDLHDSITASLRAGETKAAVAEQALVSASTINRILKTVPGLQSDWKLATYLKVQNEKRLAWRMALERNPHSGIKGIRIVEPSAYAWLYRNDADWLRAQKDELPPQSRHSKSPVNWDVRDHDLCQLVRTTCMHIAQEAPYKRIKLWQIYQRIPGLKTKLERMDKLPLTQAAIRSALQATLSKESFDTKNVQMSS